MLRKNTLYLWYYLVWKDQFLIDETIELLYVFVIVLFYIFCLVDLVLIH